MVRPLENSPYRLIVEGRDDQHSITELLARHGYNWEDPGILRPYIKLGGGIAELLEELPVVAKGPYRGLGIVVDANTQPAGRWEQVRVRLKSVGFELPQLPNAGGTIVQGLRPGSQLGVWLMPDNRMPGMLEDFLAKLVPDNDPCWTYAQQATEEAKRQGAPFTENVKVKAVIHTWLAWQDEPGLPFGTALRAVLFRHDTPEALAFVQWFTRLFPT